MLCFMSNSFYMNKKFIFIDYKKTKLCEQMCYQTLTIYSFRLTTLSGAKNPANMNYD